MPGSRLWNQPHARGRAACPSSRVHRRLARYFFISGTRFLQETGILSLWGRRGLPRWTSTDFPEQALLTRSAALHPPRQIGFFGPLAGACPGWSPPVAKVAALGFRRL